MVNTGDLERHGMAVERIAAYKDAALRAISTYRSRSGPGHASIPTVWLGPAAPTRPAEVVAAIGVNPRFGSVEAASPDLLESALATLFREHFDSEEELSGE
jgi:hypothetical protein